MFKRKESAAMPVNDFIPTSPAQEPEVTAAPVFQEEETLSQIVSSLPEVSDSTTIPANCVISGEITSSGDIHGNGTVEGKVRSEKSVFLLKDGKVEGEINADKIVISGRLNGLCSSREVEISASGFLEGTLECDELFINKKGRFYGISKPLTSPEKPAAPRPASAERPITTTLSSVPDFLRIREPMDEKEPEPVS